MSRELLLDTKIGRLIEQALAEDIGLGDITSDSLIPDDQRGRGMLTVKENGILSGMEIVDLVYQCIDPQTSLHPAVRDGTAVSAGQVVAEVHGPVRSLLHGERVALNFLQRMSGIATLTHAYVRAVAGTYAKITDTRKTAPGLRMLDKKAVRDGGGMNHRFGLDQMVLIKDNHIAAAGGIRNAVTRCRQYLHEHSQEIKIEVETTSLQQVREAVETGGVNRIMLDNFDLPMMRIAVQIVNHAVEVEASGRVTLETVRSIAETGVDYISVGALTHSPKALDISLELAH